VQPYSHDVVLTRDGAGGPEVEDVLTALAPRFSVAPTARPRTVRRTWLDTFDWRLHRAGLTLEHVTGTRPGELVLTGPSGERLTQRASRLSWPMPARALPAGPVADRVGPAAGIRALLPAARAVSTVQDLRLLNADTKTVAWITLDRTAAVAPAAAQLPARLQVSAVRGYQAQAQRAAALLDSAALQRHGAASPLEEVLAAAGRRPGDYSNKITTRLAGRMPARAALRAVLLGLLDTLQANVPGTVRDLDTEFLHDLRVSARRTRSALKLAGDVLPEGLAARYRGEFKWLGDLTTPTRDLDVYLLGYDEMAAGLLAAQPDELAPFRRYLERRRVAEQRALARGLRSARFTRLACEWRAALHGLPVPEGRLTTEALAADRLARAHRRVIRDGCAITPQVPAERLHDLRKRCKELRYLLEFFASVLDPQAYQPAVRDLKGLQDCLGEFQDRQVQHEEIREFATQMLAGGDLPATALLAMGELSGQVARAQQRARGEFASRFAVFAGPASQRRFAALTAGGGQ
jgi:CHAD domain-containing protein